MAYQVADGWNNAAALANLTVQPKSYGIQWSDSITGLTGDESDDGTAFFEWIYTSIFGYDLATVFAALGVALTGPRSNHVTARTLQDPLNEVWANYNCIVIRPEIENRGRYALYRNIVFKFTDADEL